MKKILIALTFTQVCVLQIFAQESSVKILLNEEERFRFDSIRLEFINAGHHVMIGDSTGMNNTANSQTEENTFIGHRAGSINRLGKWNTFLGARAGENHVRGHDNLFLGAWAGRNDSTGYINTYIGTAAGWNNKTGQSNTFVGWFAGANSDSCFNNTFLGRTAGNYTKGGEGNVFVGLDAGRYSGINGSVTGNTYIGTRAGCDNPNGEGNVFIGYFAGAYDTSSNNLIIANSQTSYPLIYGEFDTQIFRINAHRMEMRNNEQNIIIGDSSAMQTYGYQNVILGSKSGKNIISANRNTYIGYKAGYNDTSGRFNVFIGMETGLQNTSGSRNTFVGTNAGYNNTTGLRNTFIGLTAGGANTTGSYNTYLGRIAGSLNETGDSNVFIGNAAGQNEMGSNKLYISNSETVEPLIYGDFAEQKLKFYADSVQVTGMIHSSGEIRTEQQFNTSGNPGITDTINTITSISFAQNKLKYRTAICTGGIITFLSEESGWVDSVRFPILHSLDVDFEDGTTGPLNPAVYGCGEWSTGLGIHPLSESLLIVDNPDPSGINTSSKVMRFTRRGLNSGGDFWAGVFASVDPAIDFTHNKYIHVKIWKPRISPVKFKIEGGNDGTLEIASTIPQSDTSHWIDMVFDFSSKTGLYSNIALLPDYEEPMILEEDIEIYFDDIFLNNDPEPLICGDSLTDSRDGRKYATVLIGNQCWMAENLNTSKYRNNDSIPNVSDGTTWSNLTSGAFCWYNNDSATYENIYGKLYNWFAIVDIRGLCPTGWHGPTDAEWTTMTDYLGGLSVAGGKLKEAGTTHWQSPNTGATNESGFTALPGGGRYDNGSFDLIGQGGYWWSATEGDALGAYDYSMHFSSTQVYRYNYHKSGGDAVRCVKDN